VWVGGCKHFDAIVGDAQVAGGGDEAAEDRVGGGGGVAVFEAAGEAAVDALAEHREGGVGVDGERDL
jgi:hypothetical protein